MTNINNKFRLITLVILAVLITLVIILQKQSPEGDNKDSKRIQGFTINSEIIGKGPTELGLAYASFPFFSYDGKNTIFIQQDSSTGRVRYMQNDNFQDLINEIEQNIGVENLMELDQKKINNDILQSNYLLKIYEFDLDDKKISFTVDTSILQEDSENQDVLTIFELEKIINNNINSSNSSTFYSNDIIVYTFPLINLDDSNQYSLFPIELNLEDESRILEDTDYTIQKLMNEKFEFKDEKGILFRAYYVPILN